MAIYYVDGKITFDVELEIEANSEAEALKKAEERVKDFYHLNVHGADHDPNLVKLKFDATHEDDIEWVD